MMKSRYSGESGPGLFSHSMARPGLYISSGPSAGPRREWVQLLSLGKAGDGMMKAEGAGRTLEVMLVQSGKKFELQPPLPGW